MSTEPLALVTGDWHVRKVDRVWHRRDNLCGDTNYGITQINQLAEEHNVPNVLLLGDLFDLKAQQSPALSQMRHALDTFQKQNRQVLYVQGQHELSQPPILQAMHQWPTHIHHKTVSLTANGPTICGLDYQQPSDVENELNSIRNTSGDILATHQVWRDFMGEDRGDAWFHWTGIPVILTGDFHQTLWEERGDKWIMSPGPLCMQSISEPADKYVFILNDDMTATKIQLGSRGYFEAKIHNQEDLDSFLDSWNRHPARMPKAGVPPEVSTNIIRVWYQVDVTDARERIEARVGDDAHLFLKTIPVEDTAMTVEAARRVQAVLAGGLEGCIRTFYADDSSICNDATRLARTLDIDDELLHIFKDHMYGSDDHRKGTL